MGRFQPYEPPFWEKQKGGPITEAIRRARDLAESHDRVAAYERKNGKDSVYELQFRLFYLEYGKTPSERNKDLERGTATAQKLKETLQRLGVKPWPAPVKKFETVPCSPDFSKNGIRTASSLGDGNSWVMHHELKEKE